VSTWIQAAGAALLSKAQTWTGIQTFTATGSGTTGAIITDDLTIQPNSGIPGGSAEFFLDNTIGQIWEVFCNSANEFGVFDVTHSVTPFVCEPNASNNMLILLDGVAEFTVPVQHRGGTDTSFTAAASSPSFSSGVAAQVNTTQDVMLYITVNTVAALAVAIGPTSGTATTIVASENVALGVITLRIPKGWWVKITGTIADLTITAVTC
jgi:hypothetical protein